MKRATLSPEYQRIIMERQKHRCAICQDEEGPLDFDHITPIAIGGTDDLDNLQALRIADHRLKSEQEKHVYGQAWSSRLNRDTREALLDAPIPRQLEKAERLPIANFLDRVEVFEPAQVANADFVIIDAGSPALCDRQNFTAYAGPRWYGRDITQWIL